MVTLKRLSLVLAAIIIGCTYIEIRDSQDSDITITVSDKAQLELFGDNDPLEMQFIPDPSKLKDKKNVTTQ